MFEIVFLGGIAAVIYRRRVRAGDWSRGDFHRFLVGLGGGVSRAVAAVSRSWPGLLRQCSADVKSLVRDVTGVVRIRRRQVIGTRPSRLEVPPTDVVAPAEAATGAESRIFSRLQRRYVSGRISFSEYVEGVRRLRGEGAALQGLGGTTPPGPDGEARRLAAER